VSGKYKARRKLTPDQIVSAAKACLSHRFDRGAPLSSPQLVRDYLAVHYIQKLSEIFTVLFLDNQNRMIAAENLFHGTIDGAQFYPREIARRSLDLDAAAVILSHNHPSGSVKPSPTDIQITKRIQEALELIDVRTLDVTTHPVRQKSGQKEPAGLRPTDGIRGWPWSGGRWRCGNRPGHTAACESNRTPSA